MTRDEILNMPAGREMDALIWKQIYKSPQPKPPINDFPSTNIDCAFGLVEKMEELEFWLELSNVIPNSDPIVYEVTFRKHSASGYACEDTVSLAICRAALLAVLEPHE